ncbi:hypothetical protein CDD81_2494 [Ophiocordyceps australis]|uniref:Uncharacterized protein n=1 Tax=Ophiocordyceps australis TaxID=1399860 RepID=A0A2C5YD40_9HYPO|nr:hypothetical protein CDD81_2494 [Ophiocordyceps australis]
MDSSQSSNSGARHHGTSHIQKPSSAADRMAALRARVAAAVGTSKAKGGLNVGLHPALEDLGLWKQQTRTKDGSEVQLKSQQPESTKSAQGSQRALPSQTGIQGQRSGPDNPYFDESLVAHSRGREPKRLVFNQKGKYIQQANALRRQAALEAMKKRIAEQTRKAGIDDDIDVEKNFVVEEPPGIEWWDEGLIDGQSYDEIENEAKLRLTTPDSIVTEYIQHPVMLEPPQDRQARQAKPMFLTPREQAKLRRQRRMAELKEMQAKIRLGLVPAPPPKVKKGNLMRVLGDVAVKDPTAVETRVNREIAERHQQHVKSNEERHLTKEQRHEKLASNQQKDADKGIHVLVFKITSLANGQHRYKIGVNAEQLALTGMCIMHPKFSLVIVEGGAWSINKYKKLILNRIDWTENSAPRRRDDKPDPEQDWFQTQNKDGGLKDMSLNECKLVFEGEQKARAFRKWGSKICDTDAEARDTLARAKMDNFWSLAKSCG